MYIPTNSDMCIRYDDVLEAIEEFESAQESDDPDEEIALPYSAQSTLRSRSSPTMRARSTKLSVNDFVRHIRDLIDECYEMPRRCSLGSGRIATSRLTTKQQQTKLVRTTMK